MVVEDGFVTQMVLPQIDESVANDTLATHPALEFTYRNDRLSLSLR